MLGVHFALSPDQEQALLTSDDAGEFLGDLEETWEDDALKVDSEKAWDAIDRCLSGAGHPLPLAVLGGRRLPADHPAVYLTTAQVHEVAKALPGVSPEWLRTRFDAIDDPGYRGALDDLDFAYTWENFTDLRAFYDRAAVAGRAVVFTAT